MMRAIVSALDRLVPGSAGERMVALARLVSLSLAPITASSIALFLPLADQGYYYAFGSIIGAQILFELGVGYVIVQVASHEAEGIRIAPQGISGGEAALARLGSLMRLGLRWNAAMALAFTVCMGVGGFYYLDLQNQAFWSRQGPWLSLVCAVAVILTFAPIWSVLEGCNQVTRVYGMRSIRSLTTTLVIIAAFCLGAGLWASAIAAVSGIAVELYFMLAYRNAISRLWSSRGPEIYWRSEIWPFQWRISISWASGYFVFSAFVPIAFRMYGPELAGKIGMTLSILNSVTSISNATIQANVPTFGLSAARRDWAGLNSLFLRKAAINLALFVAGCMAAVVGLLLLQAINIPILRRVLDPESALVFAVATFFVQVSTIQGAYVRAYKREPFVWLSPAIGLMIVALCVTLGRSYGPMGFASGYLATFALFAVPVGGFILLRCRSRWQSETSSEASLLLRAEGR